MKRLLMAVSIALMFGCNSNPTTSTTTPSGTITITSPAGGETYKIGDPVTITWACTGCTGIPTDDVIQVGVYDGSVGYLIIATAAFTDSKTWTAGTTLQNVSLLPGVYAIVLQDTDGFVAVQGGTFQIVS